MPWPITRDDVVSTLGVTPHSTADEAWVQRATDAAVKWVERVVDATRLADADTIAGACLLATRLYSRRNSPGGVVALGELGATYVARADPDVVRLLGLGAPRVG